MSLTNSEIDPKIAQNERMVEIDGLKKYFPVNAGIIPRKIADVRAVDGVSFDIYRGETFGLVGESGCGKSTLAKAVLRIIEPTDGSVHIDGKDITSLEKKELREFRADMQIVYQDPTSSLNPRKRIKDIIAKPMRIHGVGTAEERHRKVEELLDRVGLPKEYLYKHPGELSGGQKQRVNIARAIILNPKFVILDEPTSALDVSVQARIIGLLEELQEEFNLTYLFISHDLSLIRNISDRIGVMYLGRIVEIGDAEEVYHSPQHPYTRGLISSVSTVSDEEDQHRVEKVSMQGEIPDPREKPTGCAFRTRCPFAFDTCEKKEPGFYELGRDHEVKCYLHDVDEPHAPEWD